MVKVSTPILILALIVAGGANAGDAGRVQLVAREKAPRIFRADQSNPSSELLRYHEAVSASMGVSSAGRLVAIDVETITGEALGACWISESAPRIVDARVK